MGGWMSHELEQIGTELLQAEARQSASQPRPPPLAQFITPEALEALARTHPALRGSQQPSWRARMLHSSLSLRVVAQMTHTPSDHPDICLVLKAHVRAAASVCPLAGVDPNREVSFYRSNLLPATGSVRAPRCLWSEEFKGSTCLPGALARSRSQGGNRPNADYSGLHCSLSHLLSN